MAPTRRVLAFLMLVGAALRFARLDHQSFWYDESVSVRLALQPLEDILTGRAMDLGNPPFYIAVLHLWIWIVGSGDAAVRALSATVSVASIPWVYAVSRQLVNRRIGLVAAAIFCVAPVQIYYAQEARAYALATLLCLISVHALLKAVKKPGWNGWWLTFTLATFLALYTYYFAIWVVAAEAVWLLYAHRRMRGTTFRFVMATTVAGSLVALAWLPSLLAQAAVKGNVGRAQEIWTLHVLATPMVLGVGQTLVWRDLVTAPRLAAGVIASLTFAALAAAGAWRLRKEKPTLVLLTAWLLLPVALPVLVSATLFPLYYSRYALPAAPAYYLLMAAGITSVRARVRGPVVCVLALVAAVSLGTYFTMPIKQDWRAAAAWTQAHRQPGNVLMFAPAIGETSFAHYAGDDRSRVRLLRPPDADPANRYWGASPGSADRRRIDPAAETSGRVWLVLSDIDSGTRGYYRALFEREWTRVASHRFKGIEILIFDRP